MRKSISIIVILLICVLVALPTNASYMNKNNKMNFPDEAVFKKVLSIDIGIGTEEVGYSPKAEGIVNEGPASFTIDNKKNIYILDTLNKKIMVFKKGKFDYNISIDFTNYARDILYKEGNLYILDEPNHVYSIDLKGEIKKLYKLPEEIKAFQVKGLSVNYKGDIVVQSEGYEYYINSNIKSKGYSFGHDSKFTSKFIDDKHIKIIENINSKKNREVEIVMAENSGCVHIIGMDKKKNIYISVEEDIPDSPLVLVEHTIRKIDSQGNQVGFARIPLEEYYNFPIRFANVTEDEEVYIMALKENCVEIYEIVLGKMYKSKIEDLKEKAKKEKQRIAKEKEESISLLYDPGIPTRTDTKNRADDMINLNWTYNTSNTDKPQSYVITPDHLQDVTSFPSSQVGIPYC